ncbi:MAG: sulfatase-like hydrolase/transferase [Alphaproteobacteria bacterium]|nr:sulfatase-like hydrolase/transferase [Alphaproteobacteria bacterium]
MAPHHDPRRRPARPRPSRQGFDTHIGSIGNLQNDHSVDGQPQNYYDWERWWTARSSAPLRTYATTDEVDDALRLVRTMPEPFFLQVSFHASHYPWQPPPAELTHDGNDGSGGKEAQRYRAIVDALDHEMGRLLDGLPTAIADDTIVIYLSDNGSDPRAMMAAYKGHASKGFVSELGVRVPLVVAGPGVDGGGRWDHSLVHAVDLFATVLDLAGVPRAVGDDLDSVSFAPRLRDPSARRGPRRRVAEQFQPNGDGPYKVERIMIRDDRYKLVRDDATGVDQLFLLDGSLLEGDDLLEARQWPRDRRRARAPRRAPGDGRLLRRRHGPRRPAECPDVLTRRSDDPPDRLRRLPRRLPGSCDGWRAAASAAPSARSGGCARG